jgi:hypothetical protein
MLINMIVNAFSFFIVLYVLHILFRRKWVVILASTLMMLSQVSNLISIILSNEISLSLIWVALQMIGGPAIAILAFFYYIGDLRFSKVKRKKLKDFNLDITTKRQFFNYAITAMIGSIVILVSSYFFVEGFTQYLLFGLSLIMLVFGIALLVHEKSITNEMVILLVGKEKNKLYFYEIPKHKTIVKTEDFFKNDIYIVDKIGQVEIKLDQKKVERHYLYWIATNDTIDMKNQNVEMLKHLSYKNLLDHFEKYHYRSMTIQISKMGNVDILKNKLIK